MKFFDTSCVKKIYLFNIRKQNRENYYSKLANIYLVYFLSLIYGLIQNGGMTFIQCAEL